MSENPLRDLLLKIRYDATAIQAKVTDLLNLVDELHLDPAGPSPSDRAFAKAKAMIEAEWWDLDDLMLETEIDLLGVPHVDRQELFDLAHAYRANSGQMERAG